jgi:hypothetical protein
MRNLAVRHEAAFAHRDKACQFCKQDALNETLPSIRCLTIVSIRSLFETKPLDLLIANWQTGRADDNLHFGFAIDD